MPSASRLSCASGLCVKRMSDSRSVRTRFCSSGIVQSRERSPRLDVGDADSELGGRERAGERRVHVAAHDDELGALFEEHALEGDEREAGLLPVRAGPDPEEAVRPREAEVVEDLRRHALVVVLARVDDELAEEATPPARLDDRRHLDEVRASSDCEDDRRHVLPGSQCDAGLGR